MAEEFASYGRMNGWESLAISASLLCASCVAAVVLVVRGKPVEYTNKRDGSKGTVSPILVAAGLVCAGSLFLALGGLHVWALSSSETYAKVMGVSNALGLVRV